jgi:signal transduction histidine kinase
VRALRNALWPAAFAFGIAAELSGTPPLPALDATTGFSLLALGLLAHSRRPGYAVGWIVAAAGVAWFAGTIAGWAVFWHRAPLAQLILAYPATKLWPASPVERAAVAVAYVYAIAYPVASNDEATIVFALALVGLAGWGYLVRRGPERRARTSALIAAVAFAVVLIVGATLRLAGPGGGRQVLTAYELMIVAIAAGLTADLLWGRWTQGLVTAVVVDVGGPLAASTLRTRLARTLGDPTLTVGYWVSDQDHYVDEDGRPLALPADEHDRAVTLIDDAGSPLAALIHDPAILSDPDLVSDITAAARLAVTNARLQAEIRARAAQVDASRRRLIEAADEQRRQLEQALRDGAERRLTHVAELLAAAGPPLAEVTTGLDSALAELRELARGIHPATLTNYGLHTALDELAARSPIPVDVSAPAQRLPAAVEAAAYFVCSEAITNAAKHAQASRIHIRITDDDEQLQVEIADDGIGGAGPTSGSGLRGLTDRVEALGGRLTVDSPAGHGTRLTAQLPLVNGAGSIGDDHA